MDKKMKLCLLSTLLIFMISSGPLLAFAGPDISAAPAALGGPAEMKITVIEDEAIERENPDDNNYANNHRGGLWVGYDGGIMTRTWLKFNLANVPQEIGIAGASLNVYLNDEFNTADLPIGVHYAANDTWDETTLTWNLQTPFDASPLDAIDSPATPDMFVMGNWYSWDVTTAFVNSLNTDKGLSFVMKQIDEVSTTITWKYFLDEDYNATATLYGAYLSVDYTTPDAVDLTVDGFSSPPLSNYVQDSTPTFEWGMSDSGTGEHQRDYELEVWNNAHYNDTLLWTEEHTDHMVVHDSSTGANYAPFGYAAEMRYQMKYPSSLMSRSGVVDKLQFEIITTPGEIVLENLQINMACVENALDLTTDFAANYDGVQPITVLNTPSYTALVVNNRITIDIENIFYLNHDLNLIVEVRFTNNTGTISTTPRTLAAGGSVAYSYGPGDYYSTAASVADDRMNTLEVYFESDKIWDSAGGIGNAYPLGTDDGYGGRFQIKYNKSMITETGVIDKIWFPVNQFSAEMTYENLVIRMAESTRLGELSHTDFASNYVGTTSVTVLNRPVYELRNLGFAAVIDLDNVFHYSGEHDLLIDFQWENRTGDIVSVVNNANSGAYRSWNTTYLGSNYAGNDTGTYQMYLDFLHPESSIEFDGTPLTNATTYYWRVRTCDSTGIWSDWTNHQFKYEELSSVPEFSVPLANPAPVVVDNLVTVSINVTYFLGINEVLMEFGGSNHSMTADGDTYSLVMTPATVANITYTIYMESNIHTWSSTSGLIVVTEAPAVGLGDTTLLIIIAAGAVVLIIVLVLVFKKKK